MIGSSRDRFTTLPHAKVVFDDDTNGAAWKLTSTTGTEYWRYSKPFVFNGDVRFWEDDARITPVGRGSGRSSRARAARPWGRVCSRRASVS